MKTTIQQGRLALQRFLDGETQGRVFSQPCAHPSGPTGFCPCDGSFVVRAWFYLKAGLLLAALRSPFNRLKIALLRRAGARVGEQVYISTDVWIDPLFPQLLDIEDCVLIGVGAKIALHEFTQDEFRAGRVRLRRGAIIGASAMIRYGIEVGEYATVSAGAAVARDVPPGMVAIGNPARNFPGKPAQLTKEDSQ